MLLRPTRRSATRRELYPVIVMARIVSMAMPGPVPGQTSPSARRAAMIPGSSATNSPQHSNEARVSSLLRRAMEGTPTGPGLVEGDTNEFDVSQPRRRVLVGMHIGNAIASILIADLFDKNSDDRRPPTTTRQAIDRHTDHEQRSTRFELVRRTS